jgi:hypothetical protein
MLSFKQFLRESVEIQSRLVRQVGDRASSNMSSTVRPRFEFDDAVKALTYNFNPSDFADEGGRIFPTKDINIKVFHPQDNPLPPGVGGEYDSTNLAFHDIRLAPKETMDQLKSTLQHELTHAYQGDRAARTSGNDPFIGYDRFTPDYGKMFTRGANTKQALDASKIFKYISYWTSPQEKNARAIELGIGAQDTQKNIAISDIDDLRKRRMLGLLPGRTDFTDAELERIARDAGHEARRANVASQRNIRYDLRQEYNKFNKIAGKSPQQQKEIERAINSTIDYVDNRIARQTMDNEGAVVGAMRDRLKTPAPNAIKDTAVKVGKEVKGAVVANIKPEGLVSTSPTPSARSIPKGGTPLRPYGLSSTPGGLSPTNPWSIADMGVSIAGDWQPVGSRQSEINKAAASIGNPFFTDSEQMMGDALLRGRGEEFAIDPTFLRVDDQRRKDREKEQKDKNKRSTTLSPMLPVD